MKYQKFNEELFSFIKKATCAFTGINTIKEILLKNDFKELQENEKWDKLEENKYFVIRNDASIIAFTLGNNDSFNIRLYER